jgi:enoyl-CoA hydratase/carnithine racemase
MEHPYRSILVQRDGGVASVTLNRPERMNVLNSEALRELDHALRLLALDEECRSVVFRSSSEKAFTAGADIREMRGLDPPGAKRFAELGHGVAMRLERELPPVVMAANGYVMGGGVELACACDFRIDSEDAVFSQPEINIGIFPGWGGSQRLARVIGLPRARELIYTGRKIYAQEALGLGLVHAVVPKAELQTRAVALATELAAKSRTALMAAKRAVNAVSELPLTAGLEFERHSWAMLFGSEGQVEGMAAFLEHREPRFQKRPPAAGDGADSSGV